MVRPCFLVVDREHSSSISTRKLVIETAKFNVLTAYSAREALETFQFFPKVSGVVLDSSVKDVPCDEVVAKINQKNADTPVIVVRGPGGMACPGADHYLDTFDPAGLLELLRRVMPRETAVIDARNTELHREGE